VCYYFYGWDGDVCCAFPPPPSVAGLDLREFLVSVASSKEATSCIKTHHSIAYLDLHSAQHLGRREECPVTASKGT